ncbi:hypothetical protein CV102_14395 [Natronococcus pandeyae]|uniref:Uncharacterized protein n=1 Tax=Natronococcus pandeyae TaxID=2055836 RepID=A0A8J8TPY2_9EURY|nr:hypothetical protein [Natronococcus pandeyae]TYL37913.1 hypothetical protein CV102_14395 [Natronococcus pandeyae]
MAPQSEHQERAFDLSREEQWVLHHTLLDRMESEVRSPADTDPPPLAVYRVFEKLEAGTHRFSQRERRCLRDELRQCVAAAETPDRDRPIAERLLVELETPDATDSVAEPLP